MTASSCSVVSTAGAAVKSRLVKLSLISSCALIGAAVFAQTSSPPGIGVKPKAKTQANKPKTLTAAANIKGPSVATTVVAAGSVIILADGIVANAHVAPVEPPADGFVYER
jgi:hypothetical protein